MADTPLRIRSVECQLDDCDRCPGTAVLSWASGRPPVLTYCQCGCHRPEDGAGVR